MRLRDRIWPGLRARSIWFDVGLAVAGSVSVGLSAADLVTPEWTEPFLVVGAMAGG